ncbi:hypothetical protein Taro_033804, partial [Colocasia esculenta]|nr:hypothetical protein [Colocasia esculenta]
MELDLDSLLRSHGASGSDDDDDEAEQDGYRRTVDEILNDSDSSSHSSGGGVSRRASFGSLALADGAPSESLDLSGVGEKAEEFPPRTASTETLEELSAISTNGRGPRELPRSSVSSVGIWSSSSFSSPRLLPPLFGGVRPNPKPGAALAAAAAASRSIPTPHAAAILSKRASASSLDKISQCHDSTEDFLVEEGANFDGQAREGPSTSEDLRELSSGKLTSLIENEDASSPVWHASADGPQHEASSLFNEFVADDVDKIYPGEAISCLGKENKALSNISEVLEEDSSQLESNKRASRKDEKRLRSSMKPLEWAEDLEKRQASSGLDWEEGAVAQPMRLEGIRREPPAVGYLQIDPQNAITRAFLSHSFLRDHGSSQTLAVHMNSIAVGTSKGLVLIFPSKYSPHCADNMDAKMLVLGFQGDKSQSPVTSMCFNQQGDLLVVGYSDGHITAWDVQRATAVKVITGEHAAPVVHTLFLGQDSQVTRQFKVVTGDSKGLVLLHAISIVPLLNRFSIKTQCLLDGQKTGTVLSASPLLLDDLCTSSAQGNAAVSTSGLGSMVGGVVGGVVGGDSGWKLFNESAFVEEGVVVFVTHQNALVVRLTPSLEVYSQFSRPDGVREGSMPYTAWKYTMCPQQTNAPDRVAWLAIAWDRKVEIFKLIKSDLTKHCVWDLDSEAIGIEWLDDQMLVILTLRGYLCLYTRDGNELHRTSFVVDETGVDDIIAYHTYFTNNFGNPEKAFHNSVCVRGATIYVLGSMHLTISRLLPWKERIQTLQKAGDWMGALDLAMRLYDGQAHGVIDLPKMIDAVREAIMPYLVEMILSYVDEVFSYISVAHDHQIGKVSQGEDPNVRSSSERTEIDEQFARVGGVAVEFCIHIKRTDILFDDIFSRFTAAEHEGTFLEILEPYILKDMLGSLPPEIMQALVEHYSNKGWLQRVEQCVLHMDISSLDFNQVIRLCREHGLYSALIYLFNRGLDDYRTPLEELLVVVQSNQRVDAAI